MATFENRLSRRKGKHGDDVYRLDTKNKTPEQNIIEIIQGLYLKKPLYNETSPTNKNIQSDFRTGFRAIQKPSSESYRMAYLNALVNLVSKEEKNNLGFTTDELMTCIRISLVDEAMVIRAAALRVLRYLIKTESDVATFNYLKLPYLVVRSMDLMLRNEEERAQALRVVRRVIAVVGAVEQGLGRHHAAYVDEGLLRCLASVAKAGSASDGTGDRLSRPAIATLAEICVLNPDLFISCGGVTAVTRQLAECATPRMAEALCGVLLHTLNNPKSRKAARIDLTFLSSPYCDFHFRPAGTDTSRDEREMRFTCSRLALLCVLRSWPGLLAFCHPRAAGGLRAIVAALHLPRLEVRKAILDLLYELVGLPQPEWTDEISVALGAVDPSDFQDSWRLNDGFVAAEGISILPHLSATGPDIIEIHLALLLQCFLEAGLLDGLAEVIVTSDTFISVRATVLLGQLLHLVHVHVPGAVCGGRAALGTLASAAAAGQPQALAATAALRRLHATLAARPAAASLFLDHIIHYCANVYTDITDNTKTNKEKNNATIAKPQHKDSMEFLNDSDCEPKQRHSVGSRADLANRNVSALVKSRSVSYRTSAAMRKVTKSSKFFSLFERDSDSLLRSSLVMQNKDGNTWNWELIRTILKETDDPPLLNLSDSGHRAWAGRIINYLLPSSNKYSHIMDLSPTCYGHSATRAGCQLIRHLLRQNDVDSQKLLEDFFGNISHQIKAIETGRKAHECLFSPQHMCNTMCQMYFLFIGQLCYSQVGLKLFKQTKLYENLLELSTNTHHSCYVKLVISSLDYTLDACPRDILAKTLTCSMQASRLYATQFLNVLLRASRKSVELIRKKSKLRKNISQEWRISHKDAGDNNVDMNTWILQMLVGQIKDESKEVAKCALTILEEAYSVPIFFEKLMSMRDVLGQNCRLDRSTDPYKTNWTAVGDRSYLLWLGLELTAALNSGDSTSMAFVKKHLEFWNKFYNYRYVRLVEAAVHEALAAEAEGRRSRSRRSVRPPPHALAVLAAAPAPAPAATHALLAALPYHMQILRQNKCSNEQEIADLKASLWALGNTAGSSQGLQMLMSLNNGCLEDSAPVHIVRLVKYCPVYSLRATAFYVLGLIGSTYDGANLLAELGWLCVRHTRHDQFPLIPEENYSQMMDKSARAHYFITSPDRRINTLDIDLSEHSDHTDQSTVESLYSDSTKLNKTIGAITQIIEKDQDVVDHKVSPLGRRETDKRKSHTLPSQGSSSQERSLTESKTVDILREVSSYERTGPHRMNMENRLILGRMNTLDHTREGRVRNTSESSTSGVSSCDSFIGKYAFPDRVLTLSPIPSSSSLYGMKSSGSTHRPRLSESNRRTSTSSFTNPDIASSPATQLDMSGYVTLQSLNKHRRPHLSESAATDDDLSWLLSDEKGRAKPFSSLRDRAKSTKERMTKLRPCSCGCQYEGDRRGKVKNDRKSSVAQQNPYPLQACRKELRSKKQIRMFSLLEYDWKQVSGGETRRAASPARAPPPAPAAPPRVTAYMGICLPRDLADIFPSDIKGDCGDVDQKDSTLSRTRVPSFLADSNATISEKLRISQRSQFISQKGTSTPANTSDIETTSSDAIGPKSDIVTSTVETRKNLDHLKINEINTDSNIASKSNDNKETETDKFNLNAVEAAIKSIEGGNIDVSEKSISDNIVKSSVVLRRGAADAVAGVSFAHVPSSCLACIRARPPSSHELRQAFFSEQSNTNREPVAEHAQLLHHVLFMANPIHLRQSRSTLLSMKQRHPEVFRSPCVYSDVCLLLSKGTYMLCARRFLQELFLDVNFDCFMNETVAILSRHAPITSMLPPTVETT